MTIDDWAGLRRWLAYLVTSLVLAGCAAQTAFRDGSTLLEQGRLTDAMGKFEQASRLEPGSAEYRIAYARTRERLVSEQLARAELARQRSDWDAAESAYKQLLAVSANDERGLGGLRQLDNQRRWERLLLEADAAVARKDWDTAKANAKAVLLEDPRHARALDLTREADRSAEPSVSHYKVLAATFRKPISIEFRDAPLKTIFEVISRSSGLNFIFDKEVKTDQKASIYLKGSTTEAVLNMLLLSNQLEQRVLDANSVLIYPSNAAKKKEYETLVVRSFYLANADAKTVATSLKNLLKLREPTIDEKLNLVVIRESPAAVRLAEKIVALHDVPEPEVMLEVEILEVKRTSLLDLGVRWPDQLTLTPLPTTSGGTLTLADLRRLNSSTVGAVVGSASLSAKNTDTDANILANPRIRARNREKAKIHIGERVPNITTTATATGFVSESVTYVDIGLKLDVEPTVYLDKEVGIKISLEVSNIISQIQTKSGTLAYQIGTRTASTVLRLRDGENQVLAGLISDEDRRTANKVPALGDIPILGRLFGNQADNGAKTEIVLSITPRVVRTVQRPNAQALEFESGTEGNVGAGFLMSPSGAVSPTSGSAAQGGSTPVKDVGAVAGTPAPVELANRRQVPDGKPSQ